MCCGCGSELIESETERKMTGLHKFNMDYEDRLRRGVTTENNSMILSLIFLL
jgi:hypothetical protein